jgi:hypothetical protein
MFNDIMFYVLLFIICLFVISAIRSVLTMRRYKDKNMTKSKRQKLNLIRALGVFCVVAFICYMGYVFQ